MNASLTATNLTPYLEVMLGSGLAVTLVAYFVKKIFKLDSPHVIHLMVVGWAAIAAVAQYILQDKSKLPPEVLGVSISGVYGFATFLYKEKQYISDFLGRVQIADGSPKAVEAAADAAVAAVTTPDEITAADAEPSAAVEPASDEFNL